MFWTNISIIQWYIKTNCISVKKNENTGIRFNLDLPSVGKNLSSAINVKGKMRNLKYSLISLPLYLAGEIRSNVDGLIL